MFHKGIKRLLSLSKDGIVILTSELSKKMNEDIKNLINEIGNLSSKEQGLKHIITTYSSFSTSDNNKIYLLINENEQKALGFIKIGYRKLFLWDRLGIQHEFNKICLLDFFVHPNCQRKGYGKIMIDKMLITENLEMKDIPIDRPSLLCLKFMEKHFNLKEFLPQSNNFVIFDQFWDNLNIINKKTPRLITPKFGQSIINSNKKNLIIKKQNLNPITWMPY